MYISMKEFVELAEGHILKHYVLCKNLELAIFYNV